jgi:hypothetical protein
MSLKLASKQLPQETLAVLMASSANHMNSGAFPAATPSCNFHDAASGVTCESASTAPQAGNTAAGALSPLNSGVAQLLDRAVISGGGTRARFGSSQ